MVQDIAAQRNTVAKTAALIDNLKRSLETLEAHGYGTIAVCDAAVALAATMMQAKVGRAGAALWMRDVFDDVRLGRL